ncbi:MAG: LuxR C-terminal-related transcriptional regulator [Desulfobacterales bacterium]
MEKDNAHSQLLRTKLHRPPVPADYVHQSRMLSHLERRCNRPLTLVSAPAGYGKSILISSWLDTSKRPGAWLSLDENDNDLRRFLLNASILERFCAPLCDRLNAPDQPTDRGEIDGRSFTDWAMASNLFIIPLDLENRWFRYHHLFRQLLRTQMRRQNRPEEIAALHSRASRWFDENGLIEEALEHAIQAGDADWAAEIVEKNRHTALNDDQWFTVEKWLVQLPIETIQQSPELLLTQAWVLNHRFRLLEIPEILERVETILQNDPSKQALTGELCFFKAFLSFWQGRMDSTIGYSEKSREQVPGTEKYGLIRGDNEIYRAMALQMIGKKEIANQTMQQLTAFAHETDDAVRHSIAQSARIRLCLLQGNLETGAESIGSFSEALNPSSFFVWLELPHITHCRQLIATGSNGSLKAAAERLDALREAAGAIHNTFHLIDILVLKALAFHKRSRREDALKILEQALTLAIPVGWIRPFVEPGHPMPDLLTRLKKQHVAGDFIDNILVAFPTSRSPNVSRQSPEREGGSSPHQPLIEPLTHREMDVLELLAKRLQNKEIAKRLSVSPETVRTHLGHIYQKLCVANRRQAVAMAKDIGILGPKLSVSNLS